MDINIKNCKVMRFGDKNQLYPYQIGGENNLSSNKERDLGLINDKKFEF